MHVGRTPDATDVDTLNHRLIMLATAGAAVGQIYVALKLIFS